MRLQVDRERLEAFCTQHHMKRLVLFSSVLREDFRPESDVYVLVEFEEAYIPGLKSEAK